MNIHGKLRNCKGNVPTQFKGCIGVNITKINDDLGEYYFENWDCGVEHPVEEDRDVAKRITDELAQEFGCKVETYCEVPTVITEVYRV